MAKPRLEGTALRAVLGAVPALVVALPAAYVVARAAYLASFTTLGRDQGIFQYIAWAMTQGDVDYRDVRDVNGPLIHGLHRLLFVLGGVDEHRFRVLDLIISFLVFGLAGAAVPGAASNRPPSALQRASFGLLGAVILGGQYLRYLAWDLAQRESMCDWFVLGAAAAFLWEGARPRRFFLAGLLLGLACFGKPTYVVFALFGALQTAAMPGDRKRNLLRYALGAAASAAAALVYLASVGDAGAFLRIYLVDAPRMYAFIWPHTARELMDLGWVAHPAKIGAAAAALGTLLAIVRVLPRRAWFALSVPIGGLVSVYLQKKGFPYHLHPVTAGAALIGVACFGALVDALCAPPDPSAPRHRARIAWAALTVGLGVFLAVHEVAAMRGSPHLMNPWTAELGATAEGRTSKAYLDRFKMWDFFPYEMRETAGYLRAHTAQGGRVQMYGMDPYVLFLAERRSASPYIYAYDLNTDAAFNGAMETLPVPKNEAAAAIIRDMGDAHARDLLERLAVRPAAAWVLFDHAPLCSYETAKEDLEKTQPAVFAYLAAHYREEARFGEIHVYLPRTNVPAP